jgi:O-acetylserine/cysteine efflux transporter
MSAEVMGTQDGMRRGLLLLVLAALAWGMSTTVSSYALRQMNAVDLLTLELITGAVVIWGITLRDARSELRTPRWPAFAVLGICEPGLTYLLANEGLARDSAATASLLLSLETVFAVVLAVLLLRERTSRWLLAAVAMGLLGAVVVASNAQPGRDTLAGHVLILASTFGAGLYSVLARRSAGQASPLIITAYQLLAAIAIALPAIAAIHLIGGSGIPHADMMHWSAGIAQGLIGVALPFLLYNRGIKAVQATVAAGTLNLIPLFGLISAVVFLHDDPMAVELLGGVLVLLGVAWLGVLETAGGD